MDDEYSGNEKKQQEKAEMGKMSVERMKNATTKEKRASK
jgi:hypothetical protein